MALVTLQTSFHDAFPAYAALYPWPAHVRTAARAIRQCRTTALGGHVHACPAGHVARVWDHACRPRACPQDAYLQTERWRARLRARLRAWDHAPVICPLPPARNPLWLAHVPMMTPLRLQTVRDTRGTVLAAPQDVGAPPGLLAALPPWSQPLGRPPHGHGLVPGGGRPPAGQWQAVRQGLLLPARVGRAVWRGQRLEARRQAEAREARVVPEGRRPQPFVHLVRRLGHPTQTRGNVRLRARSRPGAGVVTSRARSGRGGPLKHARLVTCDGARVTCPSRARQAEADGATAGAQRLTVSIAAVLPRWRRPVPRPQTRGGRLYGRYHRRHAAALAVCRAARGQPPLEAPAVRDGQTVWAPRGDAQPARCPPCGPRLVCTGVIPRGGAPPPLRAGERAA